LTQKIEAKILDVLLVDIHMVVATLEIGSHHPIPGAV
jgi:hypothetical protein